MTPEPTFPDIGEELFNLSPSELQEAWGQPALPKDEKETRMCFERLAGTSFDLFGEIHIKPLHCKPIRIDYVGVDKSGQVQGPIGFEIKSPAVAAISFADFASSLAQTIDYSKGAIQTDIYGHKEFYGAPLKWLFMFPCPYQIYEQRNIPLVNGTQPKIRDLLAQGGMKVASKFGVGGVFYDRKRADWGCFLGGHPAFWMRSGPTPLAMRHAKRAQIGSGRL